MLKLPPKSLGTPKSVTVKTKAIKKMSGSLKLELAQFRELDAFSQFGSDLDKETKDILSHGKKFISIIKQNKHMPLTH